MATEQPIVAVRASVMLYDDSMKKWIPTGINAQQSLSKVQVYHNLQNQTFRVVGRKVIDHEVVINCFIGRGLKYCQATTTFHQWRDDVQRQVYGLNFTSPDDAQNFADAMLRAIEYVNNNSSGGSSSGQQTPRGGMQQTSSAPYLIQSQQSQRNGNYAAPTTTTGQYADPDEMMDPYYHQRKASQGMPISQTAPVAPHPGSSNYQSSGIMPHPTSTSNLPGQSNQSPQRSNAAVVVPHAPPPPPAGAIPKVPPPPPGPPPPVASSSKVVVGSGAPPPPAPPPPPMGSAKTEDSSSSNDVRPSGNDLAAALANAKLRKTPRPDEIKQTRSASIGSSSNGPVRNGTSAAEPAVTSQSKFGSPAPNMMEEMAMTLARRRQQIESNDSPTRAASTEKCDSKKQPKTTNGKQDATDSPTPKTHRKVPSGSSVSSADEVANMASTNNVLSQAGKALSNATNGALTTTMMMAQNATTEVTFETLQSWKNEILTEVKKEITNAKNDIINAMRSELLNQRM